MDTRICLSFVVEHSGISLVVAADFQSCDFGRRRIRTRHRTRSDLGTIISSLAVWIDAGIATYYLTGLISTGINRQ